ncbi:MAG: GntR family transcriptional regulator [Aerococcaceae bacterium]|nr:GntR family transcriptional regulator [Aerococcaceae bacterium]
MNPIITAVKRNLDIFQNKPLKISVYEAFRKTIILGEIPAGSRINEKEFSEALNISRTPIRYALAELTKEQLVEYTPKIGNVVRGISIRDAFEIFEIRKSLDTLATIKAMENMTPEDFELLHNMLEECEQLNRDNRIADVLSNFAAFNAFIYEKSQMKRLQSIVEELKTYLFYFRDISIHSTERRYEALKEHWLILRGMKNKNIDQITLITHEHLDHSLHFIIKEMERHHIE